MTTVKIFPQDMSDNFVFEVTDEVANFIDVWARGGDEGDSNMLSFTDGGIHWRFNRDNVMGVSINYHNDEDVAHAPQDIQTLLKRVDELERVFSKSVVYEALRHYYKQGLFEPDDYEALTEAREFSFSKDND